MVVDGGMCSWPEVLGAWLEQRGGKVWRGTSVQGISRREGRVRLRLEHGDGRHSTAWFEHVVLATPPPRVLAALEDPTPDEAALLGALHWQRARVCVHQDERLLGRDRQAWGAYNYVVPEPGKSFERPTITFWPNRLASLPPEVPNAFVTMNPHREPDPRRVLAERFFVHPANARPREAVVSRLADIQGEAGTWFAGAWIRAPHVHEQALRTGLEVGEQVLRALAEPRSVGRRRTVRWEDVVRASPLLHTVDAMVLEELRPEVVRREFAAGEVVCHEGEPSDAMLFVGTGRLEVLVRGERVDEIPPGEVVGRLACWITGPGRPPCAPSSLSWRGGWSASASRPCAGMRARRRSRWWTPRPGRSARDCAPGWGRSRRASRPPPEAWGPITRTRRGCTSSSRSSPRSWGSRMGPRPFS